MQGAEPVVSAGMSEDLCKNSRRVGEDSSPPVQKKKRTRRS